MPWILLLFLLPAPAAAQSLYGSVRAADSRAPLPQATVQLTRSGLGTLTDRKGVYRFEQLPEGSHTLRVSALGYRSREMTVVIGGGTLRLDVQLEANPVTLRPVEVRGVRKREAVEVPGPPPARVTGAEVRATPALAEADVFRAVQALPSVAAASDFSSALYVRGGSPDQSLITLDGVPLFNPYHLGGIFSALDPDAVDEVEVQAGALSADVGDRLSGAVAIRSREGSREKTHGSGAVGLFSSRALVERPLSSGRGSMLVSLRRTYVDLFTDAAYALGAMDFTLPYGFTDATVRAVHDVGASGELSLTAYLNEESFRFPERMRELTGTDLQFGWGSRLVALGYRHAFDSGVLAELKLAHSDFHGDFTGRARLCDCLDGERVPDFETMFEARNRMRDLHAAMHLSWRRSGHELRGGIQLDDYLLNHRVHFPGEEDLARWIPEMDRRESPTALAAYVEDIWSATPSFALRGGVRVLSAGPWGTALLPRLGARWAVSPSLSLSFGVSRSAQLLHSLRNDESLAASVMAYDFLAAVPQETGMMTSRDVVLGARWEGERSRVAVEAYAKRFDNLLLPPIPENVLDAPALVAEGFRVGRGSAQGVEVAARHRWGESDLSLAYSLAFAGREVDGERFAPRFERRHSLDLMASTPLGASGEMSARLAWATGQPYTPVLGVVRLDSHDPQRDRFTAGWGGSTFLLGDHNSERLPGYFRLDVGARRSFQRRWFDTEITITPYLQVLNVLNTPNVLVGGPTLQSDMNPTGSLFMSYAPQLPIFPTIGMEWRF